MGKLLRFLVLACAVQVAVAQSLFKGFIPDENGINLDEPPAKVNLQTKIVTIAHVGPKTGPISHLGVDNENGAIMAVEELNASGLIIGGARVTLRLLTEDDSANPNQGVVVAKKIVAAKVAGVIGHLNSGTSIPASIIYSDAGIPQISPSATNPKYTRQGFKTTFRLVTDDNGLGNALGRYATATLKAKLIAVIDDRTAYGAGLADIFSNAVRANGGTIVAQEFTTDKATDFNSILTSIKSRNPDLIFFGGMDAVAGPLLRQMKMLGINAKFMGGDGICSTELVRLAYDAISDNQVYCAESGGVEAGSKYESSMVQFQKKYRARFGLDLQVYAPYVYDSVKLMVGSMVEAGSSEPEKYLPTLARTKNFQGVTGPITFDYKGDLVGGAITLQTVRSGKLSTFAVIR
jgi:branched-chain amino acid transport system substrate-binding protein